MNSKVVLQVIPSTITAVGINAIPAGLVLVGGESAETAMVLYFLENILLVLFTAARVRLLAPAYDEAYKTSTAGYLKIKVNGRTVSQKQPPQNRTTLLTNYLIFSLGFSLAAGVFLFFFLFLIMGATISNTAIMSGMAGIVGFQLFSFVIDFFVFDGLSAERSETLLERSMGRVALLHLAVFIGVFVALFGEQWFVLPFAALKTVVDLATPFQAFRK